MIMIKDERFNKIFSILVVLLPFLYQYKGLGSIISLGELLLFPFIIIYFLFVKEKKKTFKFSKELLFYFIIILLSIICMYFDYFSISDFLTVFFRLIFYYIVMKISINHFKINYVFKFYSKFVIILSIYLIIQSLYYTFTGGILPRYISSNLLFPPERNARVLEDYYKWTFRPSSLFLEPSYFTLFCLPYISIMAFDIKKRMREKIGFIIVIIALLLSGSSAAIVSIGIIFFFSLNYYLKNKGLKKGFNVFITIFITIVLGLGVLTIFNNNQTLIRTLKGASFNNRITRGIIIYNEMPIINKIFGVGLNNLSNYMNFHNLSTIYDEGNLEYCSTLVQMLTNLGLVGLIFFFNYVIELWKKSKKNIYSKFLFYIIIFIMSYESILFTYRFCFLYVFLIDLSSYKNELSLINESTIYERREK